MSEKKATPFPAIDIWTKFSASTNGRDKLYRTTQYLAKYYSWRLENNAASKETIIKLNSLQSSLSLSRKLLRLGKPLEHVQTIAVAILHEKDDVIKITTLGRSINLSVWLIFDMLQYLHGVGMYKSQDIKAIGRMGNKFWLIGLLFSVLMDIAKLRKLLAQEKVMEKELKETPTLRADKSIAYKNLSIMRKNLVVDLIRDTLDATIPASSLEYLPVSNGTVGIIGVITSMMGVYREYQAALKK